MEEQGFLGHSHCILSKKVLGLLHKPQETADREDEWQQLLSLGRNLCSTIYASVLPMEVQFADNIHKLRKKGLVQRLYLFSTDEPCSPRTYTHMYYTMRKSRTLVNEVMQDSYHQQQHPVWFLLMGCGCQGLPAMRPAVALPRQWWPAAAAWSQAEGYGLPLF